MEAAISILKIVGLLIFCVVVLQTAERTYQRVFPKPQPTMLIVVEHRIIADNLESSVDITTNVLSVALGVEEAAKRSSKE